MLNKYLMPALALVLAATACMFVAAGGCRGRRQAVPASAGPSGACVVAAGTAVIGEDGGVVGRLEQPATVKATVFRADGQAAVETEVRLLPGVWLVPASAFQAPAFCAKEGRNEP